MTIQDYQLIVDRVLDHFNVHPDSLKVKVKDVKGGRAGWRYRNGRNLFYITLPKWLEEYDEQYAIYYAVHETCHIVVYLKDGQGGSHHNENFKKIEDEALALYGIRIMRAKAYPKELYANGQQVYNIVRKK